MDKQPQVAVVIRPFHELGLTLCRLLALEGTRIVVLDRDPVVGEAFCQRLGLEGFSASYRYLDPAMSAGEGRLHDDLSDVYGSIRALITFFEPIAPERRLNWLDIAPDLALRLVQQSFEWRLRILKALTPLFANGSGGIVLNVLMGRRDDRFNGRPDALVAGLIHQLLEPEWSRIGVQVRQVETAVGLYTPGTQEEELGLLQEDVDRVLDMLGGDRVVAG